jgi:hypothetical protein
MNCIRSRKKSSVRIHSRGSDGMPFAAEQILKNGIVSTKTLTMHKSTAMLCR